LNSSTGTGECPAFEPDPIWFLQVNFKFNVPRAAYEQAASPLANDFTAVRGCRWKICNERARI